MGVIWASWEIVTMITGRPQDRHGSCGRHLLIFLINMTQQYHQDDATSNELFLATFSEEWGLSFVLIPFNIGGDGSPLQKQECGVRCQQKFSASHTRKMSCEAERGGDTLGPWLWACPRAMNSYLGEIYEWELDGEQFSPGRIIFRLVETLPYFFE